MLEWCTVRLWGWGQPGGKGSELRKEAEEIFEGWVVFSFYKESLQSSFCCWVSRFLIGKWGDLITGGKHLLRESTARWMLKG